MGNFWKFFFSFLLLVAVGIQSFTLFLLWKEKRETPTLVKIKEKPKKFYSISLKCGLDFLKYLNSKGFEYSYSDGRVFLTFDNPHQINEILEKYKEYLAQKIKEKSATLAVLKLVKNDVKNVEKEIENTSDNFQKLYQIFTDRGINISFSLFKEDILSLQSKVFKEYKQYWFKKREQILRNYAILVKEPDVDTENLLKKAANYFEDNLKLRLFGLYLKLKVLEARFSADLVVYGELKNGS